MVLETHNQAIGTVTLGSRYIRLYQGPSVVDE